MNCPKCHSSEIDSGGFCLVCGHRAFVQEELSQPGIAETIPSGLTEAPAEVSQADLPEWRLELSRRLQEIKAKREAGDMYAAGDDAPIASEPAEMPHPDAGEAETAHTESAAARRPRRGTRATGRQSAQPSQAPPDTEQTVGPDEVRGQTAPSIDDVAASVQPAGDFIVRPSTEDVERSRDQYTKELIDSVVAKSAVQEARSENAPALREEITPAVAPETGLQRAGSSPDAGMKPESATQQLPSATPAPGAKPVPGPGSLPASGPEGRPSFPASSFPPGGPGSGPERMSASAPGGRKEIPALPDAEPRQAGNKAQLSGTMPAPVPEHVPAIVRPSVPEAAPPSAAPFMELGESRDTRLILLSRTLAGLVDFILVILSAGVMIVTVDILEGIDVFDTVSKINYGLLFLVMYFAYSSFFLGMSGQTIGMMLTDLKLTSVSRPRPALGQIMTRCCVFLAGTTLAGFGLFWGCFDHKARCLHDLASGTRVVRTLLD